MNTWGRNIRLSIFGESHGPAVGIVVDGIPAGMPVDMEAVAREMARRAPGQSALATPRREADAVQVDSGLWQGRATGAPLCARIASTNTRSGDYDSRLRPGHADLTAHIKYGGHADMRGGGHFSGRLTAPLVFAGALAKQWLAGRGVEVFARICRIADVMDGTPGGGLTPEGWRAAAAKTPLAVADDAAAAAMEAAILSAKAEGDSVGGVVEATAFGVPAGLGEPFFAPLESTLAGLLFAVPAVKGVEFGEGFGFAALRGSEANDPLRMEDGRIRPQSNHAGGIQGGISNGAPLLLRAVIRPTPSIAKPQQTVDAASGENVTLETKGRHDPCILPRAVPVVEAAVALCLWDAMLEGGGAE